MDPPAPPKYVGFWEISLYYNKTFYGFMVKIFKLCWKDVIYMIHQLTYQRQRAVWLLCGYNSASCLFIAASSWRLSVGGASVGGHGCSLRRDAHSTRWRHGRPATPQGGVSYRRETSVNVWGGTYRGWKRDGEVVSPRKECTPIGVTDIVMGRN